MTLQRIRDLREDADYTQEYMAHLLNITQRTYSRYENGEHAIPLSVLCFLADYYETSIDYLIGRTDVRTAYPPSVMLKEGNDESRNYKEKKNHAGTP